jgi:hypothetical protein
VICKDEGLERSQVERAAFQISALSDKSDCKRALGLDLQSLHTASRPSVDTSGQYLNLPVGGDQKVEACKSGELDDVTFACGRVALEFWSILSSSFLRAINAHAKGTKRRHSSSSFSPIGVLQQTRSTNPGKS